MFRLRELKDEFMASTSEAFSFGDQRKKRLIQPVGSHVHAFFHSRRAFVWKSDMATGSHIHNNCN